MKFTDIENDILTWIRERTENQPLRHQFAAARPKKREYTGVGCFVDLELPDDCPLVDVVQGDGRTISGPQIRSRLLECGAGSMVFVEEGRVDLLEIYAYGNSFPKNLTEYQLHD